MISTQRPGNGRGCLYGVLVTFRRPSELADTLDRIARQTRPPDLLVVVDNSPSPETRALVRTYEGPGRDVAYLPTPQNLGFAGGVSAGMELILRTAEDDDWIVILDDDDPPRSDAVIARLERFASEMVSVDPETGVVGLVGGRFDWRRGRMQRVPDDELGGPVPVDFIGGGHFPLFRVRAIREAGAFSPDIFFGLSEVEHGLRLRRAGFSLYADGDGWRERREAAGRLGIRLRPSRRLGPLDWRRYYSLRNTIWILRTNGRARGALRVILVQGLGKPLVNLPLSPATAARHLRLNVRACRDGWTGRMGRRLEPDGRSRPGRIHAEGDALAAPTVEPGSARP